MDRRIPTRFDPADTSLVLRTDRLRLRPIGEHDANALFAIFSDPEVMRFWSTPPWTDPAQALESIRSTRADYENGSALRLGVEQADRLIGTCTLFAISHGNRRAEIGYALARRHWGKGYMHEALAAFVGHAFGALGLHRLEADIDPRNTASARALERLGFIKEGHLRERWIVAGEVSDSALYGLLAGDWNRNVR
ncbi:MAG TPA: GNAT family N-acetyltransferase [Paucimonas sp.]|nr:GNAT family N-acetyltransferase [Paucimonas sp.]